jgi:hypothetical protein
LKELRINDQALDQHLVGIGKGVDRLKQIAQNQSREVRVQIELADQLSDKLDNAAGKLNGVNHHLKSTLERAGGTMNILVRILLILLILATGGYLYKMYA